MIRRTPTAAPLPLLTIAELAERQRVPIGTIYRWNSDGTGPAYLRIGRHVRYRLSDVEAWEASRTYGGHPDRRPSG